MKITDANTSLVPLKRGIDRELLSAEPPTSASHGRQTIKKGINTLFTIAVVAMVLLIVISIFPVTGNYKIFVVQSGSMEPSIHTGSVVVVKPQEKYIEGDVITFKNKGGKTDSVTHRIARVENNESGINFITKGDANEEEDGGPVAFEKVIGKVLFSVSYFGYAVAAAKEPIGFMALIIAPTGIIIFEEVMNIIRELKKSKRKEGDNEN